jgi:hypothetical protein
MTEPKSVLPKTRSKELGYDRLVHSDWLPRGLYRMIMKTALLLFLGLSVLSFGEQPARFSVSCANST